MPRIYAFMTVCLWNSSFSMQHTPQCILQHTPQHILQHTLQRILQHTPQHILQHTLTLLAAERSGKSWMPRMYAFKTVYFLSSSFPQQHTQHILQHILQHTLTLFAVERGGSSWMPRIYAFWTVCFLNSSFVIPCSINVILLKGPRFSGTMTAGFVGGGGATNFSSDPICVCVCMCVVVCICIYICV